MNMFDFVNFDPAELSWAGITEDDINHVLNSEVNPLMNRNQDEKEILGLREMYLMSKCPEYLYFACKVLCNVEISPIQACSLYMMWSHAFPMIIASRGYSKSFSLALYAILRAALVPGSKIVCVGASFRQSKILYSYVDAIWKNSTVLRSVFKSSDDGVKMNNDMIVFTMGSSKLYFVPIGSGSKIRGLRANIVIADEMNSLDTDVYEVVINNFAAVSMDPINSMKKTSKIKYLTDRGLDIPEELAEESFQNQSIIAGTMGYEGQPMFNYWQKYKKIIDTKGESLKEAFGGVETDLSYKDFCIMRIPYELIPKGFMDDKTIARAKATIHIGAYNSEYGCVPTKDTTGFFKRSLIEQCVANDKTIKQDEFWPEWCPNSFDPMINGRKDYQYVLGIDPASETDNLAMVITEVHPTHQRVVYCWTINREEVKNIDPSLNYYAYCAKHIRDLYKRFNITKIGIDGQGGGVSLYEALHDKDALGPDEVPFWEEIDYSKPKETDRMSGDHNIVMVQFANYKWTAAANHNLRKDLESRTILFPRYNSLLLGLAGEEGFGGSQIEDAFLNIEELKEELTTIIMTFTGQRERWDTPQVKTDTNKVGHMKKDRYSALLIANSLSRDINKHLKPDYTVPVAGRAVGESKKDEDVGQPMYVGNPDIAKHYQHLNFRSIQR